MRIYISGKITGLDKRNYMQHFSNAEIRLTEKGHSVINPAAVNSMLPEDTDYDEYMKMSMLMLSFCDTIYMLNNYKESLGAMKEYQYAWEHGYTIMFEE